MLLHEGEDPPRPGPPGVGLYRLAGPRGDVAALIRVREQARDPAAERRGRLGLHEHRRGGAEHVPETRQVAHHHGEPCGHGLEDLEGRGVVGADPWGPSVRDDPDVRGREEERDLVGGAVPEDSHARKPGGPLPERGDVRLHPPHDQDVGAIEQVLAGSVHQDVDAFPAQETAGVQHDPRVRVDAQGLPGGGAIRERVHQRGVMGVVLHRHPVGRDAERLEVLADAAADGHHGHPRAHAAA